LRRSLGDIFYAGKVELAYLLVGHRRDRPGDILDIFVPLACGDNHFRYLGVEGLRNGTPPQYPITF
jgi:hypothetical protein